MFALISIAFAMLAGILLSRPAKKIGLPSVTAYLIAGVLIGPFFIGRLGIPGLGFRTAAEVSAIEILSDAALGFIAFDIGKEFKLSALEHTGRQATVIGIIQAVAASLIVDIVLIVMHLFVPHVLSLPAAITLGAVAAATAPAATLMVVRQYKAKGPLTNLLLPIVALDDAVGLIIFAVSYGIAQGLQSGIVEVRTILAEPLLEIAASLVMGAVMGLILTLLNRFVKGRSVRLAMCIAFVFVTVGLSQLTIPLGTVTVGFSSLLACMMLGTIFCNLCPDAEEEMDDTDSWTEPLFLIFFVVSGAGLDLDVFRNPLVVLIGVLYLLARAIGKWGGTYISSGWVKCDGITRKYLGVTLLPQAGVALGMSLTAARGLGADGSLIRNIVLFTVLILELVGPMFTKLALMKAGEIQPETVHAPAKKQMAQT